MELPPKTAHERRLRFWREVCGCQVGALCAIAALAWWVFGHDHTSASTVGAVLAGAGVVIAAGVVGKLAAIAAAHAILKVEIALMMRRAEQARCGSRS
jgi:hypothetical protein